MDCWPFLRERPVAIAVDPDGELGELVGTIIQMNWIDMMKEETPEIVSLCLPVVADKIVCEFSAEAFLTIFSGTMIAQRHGL